MGPLSGLIRQNGDFRQTALSQNKQQTYQQLLVEIRGILKAKYSQKPQLSASHPIDTSIMFIC